MQLYVYIYTILFWSLLVLSLPTKDSSESEENNSKNAKSKDLSDELTDILKKRNVVNKIPEFNDLLRSSNIFSNRILLSEVATLFDDKQDTKSTPLLKTEKLQPAERSIADKPTTSVSDISVTSKIENIENLSKTELIATEAELIKNIVSLSTEAVLANPELAKITIPIIADEIEKISDIKLPIQDDLNVNLSTNVMSNYDDLLTQLIKNTIVIFQLLHDQLFVAIKPEEINENNKTVTNFVDSLQDVAKLLNDDFMSEKTTVVSEPETILHSSSGPSADIDDINNQADINIATSAHLITIIPKTITADSDATLTNKIDIIQDHVTSIEKSQFSTDSVNIPIVTTSGTKITDIIQQ